MQSSMIPWHIFMSALAQQGHSQAEYWLERWRFTNDGVLMARGAGESKRQFQQQDDSLQTSDKQEKLAS